MWKKLLLALNFVCCSISTVQGAEEKPKSEAVAGEITGYWKTIDDKTGKPQSLVLIYPYQGKYFGRIILTYNEDGSVGDTLYQAKEKAPGIIGDPYYAGMDIIYDLVKKDDKYSDGKIVDPERGSIYDAELWLNKQNNLVVRGELLFFGQNQTWIKATDKDFPADFKKPDLQNMVPIIPQVKK